MGRIVAQINVKNGLDTEHQLVVDALVDTGASSLVLPSEWKERLGKLSFIRKVKMETADQRVVEGEVYGPVILQIEKFSPIYTEVVFLDMEPTDGKYEPIVGYIPLEQSQIAVDIVGQRLVAVKYLDLK